MPKRTQAYHDLLGAHVSTQGGVATAPERGAAIGATAIQVFTKTPNQWRGNRRSIRRPPYCFARKSSATASGPSLPTIPT